MNVLLVDPPSTTGKVVETVGRNKLITPNMGLLYIGTFINELEEVNVKIIDPQIFEYNNNNISDLLDQFTPQIVGITAKTFNIKGAYEIAELVKNREDNTLTVIGGAHPTALPEQVLNECKYIDAVVLREGEITFKEICQSVLSKSKGKRSTEDHLRNISGIVWRTKNNELVKNADRELINDLDSLPFPDFTLVDYKEYARVYNPTKRKFQYMFPVFGSRGCPYNCTFCMPLLTRKHRVRSITNIIEEIIQLNRRFGTKRIYFEDSLFCTSSKWFRDFCHHYKQTGLHKIVQWGFETRINTIDPELFEVAVDAGCTYVFFGVESGNEDVLKNNNKKYKRKDIVNIITAAKQSGIPQVNISLILGLPFETKESIQDTISLLDEVPCDGASINILDIYPGTKAAEMVRNGEGGFNWNEKDGMPWESTSRSQVTIELNDISTKDLINARKTALSVLINKRKKKKFDRIFKMIAYTKELLVKEPKTFFLYLSETLTGRK